MQALSSKINAAPSWAAQRRPKAPTRARCVVVPRMAAGENREASRRDVLMAPGLAAMLSASEQLWLPGSASAKITPTNLSATDFSTAIADAHIGPLGGAVGCTDYPAFEKVIYGFIDAIKAGEGPPFTAGAVRLFLLKEEPSLGNRVMLTVVSPSSNLKSGLPFFIESGPKANPLWAQSNETWKDPSVPIFATGSEAILLRGNEASQKSAKGKYFGQYNLGWNGKVEDWVTEFTAKPANDFHNSVGVEYSVAHKMDLKTPGSSYKTKAKTAIEVFHCFNSLEGAKELAAVFSSESPIFAQQPKYVGPYTQTIWKVMDDIVLA